MNTVDSIMGMADAYAQTHPVFLRNGTVRYEARAALLTALQDLVSERDAYQQAADKLAGEIKDMQRQEPVAWRENKTGVLSATLRDERLWTPLYAAPQPAPKNECTRSHPHELMDGYCELRTEIARLTNENARLKAASQPEQESLPRSHIEKLVDILIREAEKDGYKDRATSDATHEVKTLLLATIESHFELLRKFAAPQPAQPVVRQCLDCLQYNEPLASQNCASCIHGGNVGDNFVALGKEYE